MSISSALSNALSGLTVTSRAADVVSSNIANAMTDGYGVRQLEISSRITGNSGSGARVTGVARHEDPILTGQRRQSEAGLAGLSTQSGFLGRIETLIGTPDQPGSLAARSAAFEADLYAAAGSPESQARLSAAVASAGALVDQINGISDGIQAERLQADGDIGRAVERINAALGSLHDLNTQIRQGQGGGRDVSALLDAQARLVDEIAPLIPLQTRRDATGGLQVFSMDGNALLDGRAATLGFDPATVMVPDMTLDNASLSGLTLNGRPVATSGINAAFGGGELSAMFQQRDEWGVAAQAQIDAVARDLTARFDAAGLDPTLAAGAPGLFTDAGSLVTAANEVGLAGRLRLNAAVDPAEGGAVWRLRDGLGATLEGPTGQSAFLQAQVTALANLVPTASGGFSASGRSFGGLVSDHLSQTGFERQRIETDQGHAAARFTALRQAELAQGVDTDAEMQSLLRIEQAFAANARVITAAEQMLDELMRLGR